MADQAAPGTMAETGDTGAHGLDAQVAQSYVHEEFHGRPASWVASSIVIVGFIVGGIMELAVAAVSPGWKWLYITIGIISIIAGIVALAWPGETFLVLAEGIERHRDDNLVRGRLIAENPALRGRSVSLEMEWEVALADELVQRSGRKADFGARILVSSALAANRVATDEWSGRGGRGSLRRLVSRAFDALFEHYGSSGSAARQRAVRSSG